MQTGSWSIWPVEAHIQAGTSRRPPSQQAVFFFHGVRFPLNAAAVAEERDTFTDSWINCKGIIIGMPSTILMCNNASRILPVLSHDTLLWNINGSLATNIAGYYEFTKSHRTLSLRVVFITTVWDKPCSATQKTIAIYRIHFLGGEKNITRLTWGLWEAYVGVKVNKGMKTKWDTGKEKGWAERLHIPLADDVWRFNFETSAGKELPRRLQKDATE